MRSYIYNFHQKIITQPFSLRVIGDKKEYNEEEIFELIKKLVNYFNSIGIKKGMRVALISENRAHFLFVIFALLYIRAVPVSIDYFHKKDTLNKLTDSIPFVITDRKISGPDDKKILYFSCILNQIKRKKTAYDEAFYKIINKNSFKEAKAEDIFIVLCSSGTTGFPKKVLLSEKNIKWADEEYTRLYGFDYNNSIAFIVPAHYSLGILACGIIPFSHKKTIFINNGNKIKKCLKALTKYKINILPATPFIYNLINKQDLRTYDFSNLRICDSGGELLPVSIINKFAEKTGVTITEGYGLTETSSLTHFLIPDHSNNLRIGSMGKPCNEVMCRIVDEYGNLLKVFIPGELWVKGPQNMLGYDNSENNKNIFANNGWLKTGDIVYKDDVDYKNCKTFEELRLLIKNYMHYYNNGRAQWDLNKMTPVEYRDHLLALNA